MSNPVFLPVQLFREIVRNSGRETQLRCLYSRRLEKHVCVSLAETISGGVGKFIGRFNDYNPLIWASLGACYMCKECGMLRFDGGLMSDSENDKLLKEYGICHLIVENQTSASFQIAIRYFDRGSGNWETVGWYTFEPEERAYVQALGKPLFYYHARADDGTWSGNDYTGSVRGSDEEYGFLKKDLSSRSLQEFTLRFTE